MTSYLIDTNVLLRQAQAHHPIGADAANALGTLLDRQDALCVSPQILMEFWCVATRPIVANGLGLSPVEADRKVAELERILPLLPETPTVYREWRQVVVESGVSGRQVHDAHLVAAMRAHGITRVLTFNDTDFRRYAGITAVHPSQVPTRGEQD